MTTGQEHSTVEGMQFNRQQREYGDKEIAERNNFQNNGKFLIQSPIYDRNCSSYTYDNTSTNRNVSEYTEIAKKMFFVITKCVVTSVCMTVDNVQSRDLQ